MSKKEEFIKEQKEARTIKVKTVIVAIAFVVVAIVFTGLGWFGRSSFDSTIRSEVAEQVRHITSKQ